MKKYKSLFCQIVMIAIMILVFGSKVNAYFNSISTNSVLGMGSLRCEQGTIISPSILTFVSDNRLSLYRNGVLVKDFGEFKWDHRGVNENVIHTPGGRNKSDLTFYGHLDVKLDYPVGDNYYFVTTSNSKDGDNQTSPTFSIIPASTGDYTVDIDQDSWFVNGYGIKWKLRYSQDKSNCTSDPYKIPSKVVYEPTMPGGTLYFSNIIERKTIKDGLYGLSNLKKINRKLSIDMYDESGKFITNIAKNLSSTDNRDFSFMHPNYPMENREAFIDPIAQKLLDNKDYKYIFSIYDPADSLFTKQYFEIDFFYSKNERRWFPSLFKGPVTMPDIKSFVNSQTEVVINKNSGDITTSVSLRVTPYSDAVVIDGLNSDIHKRYAALNLFRDGKWLSTVGNDIAKFTDTGLEPSHQYSYKLSYYNTDGSIPEYVYEFNFSTVKEKSDPQFGAARNVIAPANFYFDKNMLLFIPKKETSISRAGCEKQGDLFICSLEFDRNSDIKKISNIEITDSGEGKWSFLDNRYFAIKFIDGYHDWATEISRDILSGPSNRVFIKMKANSTKWSGGQGIITYSDQTTTKFNVGCQDCDITPPSLPKDLVAVYVSSGIKLLWTQSIDDKGIAEYQIFRDGKFLGKSNTNSYTDTNTNKSAQYKYKVYAVDTSGNKSASDEISSIKKDTQAPTSPTGLEFDNPKPYNSVILKWKAAIDDLGVDHYEVYRDDKLLSEKVLALSYTDSTINAGTTYKYSVYAIDGGGNKGKAAEINVKSFKDTEPPRSINFFEVTSVMDGMNLRWGVSSSDDVDHYELYKDGKLLYQSSSKVGDQYLDKDVKQDGIYVYILYAFDYSKNRSKGVMVKKQYGSYNLNKSVYGKDIDSSDSNNIEEQSAPVATFTIDGIHDKSFTVGNTSYTYAWSSKNADTYSSAFTSNDTTKCGGGTFVANSASGSYTKASISTAMAGCVFTVTYTAKNSKTGKSASDTVVVRIQAPNTNTTNTKDTQAPSQPTGVTATTYSQNQINLKWTASTDNVGVTTYKVSRNGVVVQSTSQTSVSDTGLIPGTSYTYVVYAYDAAGNASVPSASVSARTQDNTTNNNNTNTNTNTNSNPTPTRPTAPTNLSGTAVSANQINLSWTASTDSGVINYNLYRDDSNIAIIPGTTYTDTNLDPDTTYTYKVIAYKPTSLYSDSSNVISVKTQQNSTPSPTVSITIDGVHDKTFTVGNSPYTYSWSGSNADTYTSTVTPSPASCGSTGAWIANSASGTYSKDTISSGLAGCTFTVTYTGKDSKTGKTASDTVTVRIVSGQVNFAPLGKSLLSSVFQSLIGLFMIK